MLRISRIGTPLRISDIVRGQWLSLRRQFLWPFVLVLVIELFLLIAVPQQVWQEDNHFVAIGTAAMIFLVLDLVSLFWVAMATALVAKSPNHASVSTIFRVLIVPWILFGMIAALMNLWVFTTAAEKFSWRFYLGLWVVLSFLSDISFGLPAWWRLRTRFRDLALRRVMRT